MCGMEKQVENRARYTDHAILGTTVPQSTIILQSLRAANTHFLLYLIEQSLMRSMHPVPTFLVALKTSLYFVLLDDNGCSSSARQRLNLEDNV